MVFSQWLGTHELVKRRLGRGKGQRDWGHVLFNGSVPGEQRGALVERFHSDPACRLFLATDAGGVGLNLQHAAAVVVNMDLPWNPAVLEQRIGRVHRMGQQRGVQVINFVGQGSIEEGMLSVLAFKTSLFAGVLDGGASEVFLQGTKLSKFMDSVEQVAGAMGEAEADAEAEQPAPAGAAGAAAHRPPAPQPEAAAAGAPLESDSAEAEAEAETAAEGSGEAAAEAAIEAAAAMSSKPEPAPAADPWAAVLQAGAALLQGIAAGRANGAAPVTIERDPATGQSSLRLPLPDPAVLKQLAQAFEPWLR